MKIKFNINDTVNKKSLKPFKNGSHIQTIVGFGINAQDPKKRPCAIFDDGSICNLDMLNHVIMFDIETSNGGYEKGELFRVLPSSTLPKTNPLLFFNPDVSDQVTKTGMSAIREMLKIMEESGFNVTKMENRIKYEKMGDVVYPVTYNKNGTVTLDYPIIFKL